MKWPEKNWLEWTVFGISLLLVLGTFGYLAYDTATSGDAPPDLVVQFGPPRRGSAAFQVPVHIANQGDATAEDVAIEVTLATNAGTEQTHMHFAYVPRQSSSDGWVTFQSDPSTGKLAARVLGYEAP